MKISAKAMLLLSMLHAEIVALRREAAERETRLAKTAQALAAAESAYKEVFNREQTLCASLNEVLDTLQVQMEGEDFTYAGAVAQIGRQRDTAIALIKEMSAT